MAKKELKEKAIEETLWDSANKLRGSVEPYKGIIYDPACGSGGMFLLIGRAEKAGSGVDKIMMGWQESHWRRPFLELEFQPDKVKLTLPMFSVIPDAILDELRDLFGDIDNLAPDELTVLSFCQIEGSISNHRLQYVLNRHRTDITSLLKKLCSEGYLESDNNGRWTTCKINGKVDTSDKKVATLQGGKVDTSDTSIVECDFQRKNLKREEMELIILRLCKDRYVKKEEIAQTLSKSENYIRNRILPDLLKLGSENTFRNQY
jgi:predicted HTH transcriptional regulator